MKTQRHAKYETALADDRGRLLVGSVLVVCPSTRKVLTALRGDDGGDPGVWCTLGGKVEEGENFETTTLRELQEETGYDGPIQMITGMEYSTPKIFVQNFLGIVSSQFYPTLNEENNGYAWTTIDKIPSPIHPGLSEMLADAWTRSTLTNALRIESYGFWKRLSAA